MVHVGSFLGRFRTSETTLPKIRGRALTGLEGGAVIVSNNRLTEYLYCTFLCGGRTGELKVGIVLLNGSHGTVTSCRDRLLLESSFSFISCGSMSRVTDTSCMVAAKVYNRRASGGPRVVVSNVTRVGTYTGVTGAANTEIIIIGSDEVCNGTGPREICSRGRCTRLSAASPSSLTNRLVEAERATLRSILGGDRSAIAALEANVVLKTSDGFADILSPIFSSVTGHHGAIIPTAGGHYAFICVGSILGTVMFTVAGLRRGTICGINNGGYGTSLVVVTTILGSVCNDHYAVRSNGFARLSNYTVGSGGVSMGRYAPSVSLRAVLGVYVVSGVGSRGILHVPRSRRHELSSVRRVRLTFLLRASEVYQGRGVGCFLNNKALLNTVHRGNFVP